MISGNLIKNVFYPWKVSIGMAEGIKVNNLWELLARLKYTFRISFNCRGNSWVSGWVFFKDDTGNVFSSDIIFELPYELDSMSYCNFVDYVCCAMYYDKAIDRAFQTQDLKPFAYSSINYSSMVFD